MLSSKRWGAGRVQPGSNTCKVKFRASPEVSPRKWQCPCCILMWAPLPKTKDKFQTSLGTMCAKYMGIECAIPIFSSLLSSADRSIFFHTIKWQFTVDIPPHNPLANLIWGASMWSTTNMIQRCARTNWVSRGCMA